MSKVVRRNKRQIQSCYERVLKRNPNLSGKVAVSWRIRPDGGVSSVRIVKDTVKDAELRECIRGKVSRWSFPKTGGGVVRAKKVFVMSSGS